MLAGPGPRDRPALLEELDMEPERLKRLVERMLFEHGSGMKGSARRYRRLRRLFDAVMEVAR